MEWTPIRSERKRRGALVMLAGTIAAMIAVPAISQAGAGWAGAGGDPGRSGHQAVGNLGLPIESQYGPIVDVDRIRTPVLITDGPDPSRQIVVYGTRDEDTGNNGWALHLRKLANGQQVAETTGTMGIKLSGDADGFGPMPGGVSPVDSSSGGQLGQVFMVYNRDNANVVSASPPGFLISDNDIALAMINPASGGVEYDSAVGSAPSLEDPTAVALTAGYTIRSSPVMTPSLSPSGDRAIFFVAQGAGTIARLFKIEVTNAGSPDATFAFSRLEAVTDLNPNVSPTIAYLRDPSRGTVIPYVVVAAKAAAGASDLRTYKTSNLAAGPVVPADVPGEPRTPSVPVTASGLAPGQAGSGALKAPALYVAYADGDGTTVHKFVQPGDNAQLVEAVGPSPQLEGMPAPGLALNQEVIDGLDEPGRVVVATGSNIVLLDTETLQPVERFRDPGEGLLTAGQSGFSRTTPATSGELVFATRDDGQQLVFSIADADPVPLLENGGFNESIGNGTSTFALGQPAIARDYVVFTSDSGLFTYRGAPRPDLAITSPSSNALVRGDSVPITVKVTDQEGVTGVEFKLDGQRFATDDAPDSGDAKSGSYSATLDTTVYLDGPHVLTVEATNARPLTGTTERRIVIDNFRDPLARLAITPVAAPTGTLVTFDGSSSVPTKGENEVITRYEFDFDGDGKFDADNGSRPNVTTSYKTGGVRNVVLRVTDSNGDTSNAIEAVVVTNRSPVPAMFANPNPIKVGQAATFDASGTVDPDGTIARYEWDLDSNDTFEVDTGATPTASRAYPTPGRVVARVRVTDDMGAQAIIGIALNVEPGPALPIASDAPAKRPLPRVSLRVTPARDTNPPFRFSAAGSVILPQGVSPRGACTGRVLVDVKVGVKRIATVIAPLRADCRYKVSIQLSTKRVGKSGKLRLIARFRGNAVLGAARSLVATVAVRTKAPTGSDPAKQPSSKTN